MKIYLTGSTGFIGSHLSIQLLKLSHIVFAPIRNLKLSQKNIQNTSQSNYLLTNFFSQDCGMKRPIEFATTQPNINFTGGALGIGANGIHYLDLLFFLYNAKKAKIAYATIEPETIESGRGSSFKDFGGLIVLEFEDESGKYLGRGTLSLSSTSSVFGGWEIIGSNGRIRINELENQRVDIIRDEKRR